MVYIASIVAMYRGVYIASIIDIGGGIIRQFFAVYRRVCIASIVFMQRLVPIRAAVAQAV
jgi:hypothetical protein